MKLLALLSPALLAATAYATDAESSSAAENASSESSSTSTKAPEPTPVGQLWAPQWTAPASAMDGFSGHCLSTQVLTAELFALKNLYPTLKDFAPQLKVFYNKQHYPGSWDGEDKHGEARELLKMDYEALPYGVREWITKNKKQRWFSVQGEVVFFAPGAIYPLLPLWVDEAQENGCDGIFDDLENYSTTPKDGAVVGKVEHRKMDNNVVEITIEAFQVRDREAEAKRAAEREAAEKAQEEKEEAENKKDEL